MAEERGPRYWCRSWKAVADRMPPEPTIRVNGVCTFPTGGYRVELVRSKTGSNEDTLALDVVVRRPTGPVTQAFADVPVEFKVAAKERYSNVTITHATGDPATSTATVPVEEVD